jgi:hypothetical protein
MTDARNQTRHPIAERQGFDQPSSDPAYDLLNADQQALGLAQYMRRHIHDLPFTVGVFGEWGEGKTTLVGLLYRHLRTLESANAGEPLFVHFSAWPYTTAEKLWRALILEIAQVLYGRKPSGFHERTPRQSERSIPPQEAATHDQAKPAGLLAAIAHFLAGDAVVLKDAPPRQDDDGYDALIRQLDNTDYGAIEQRSAHLQIDADAAMSALFNGTLAVLGSVSPLVAGLRSLLKFEPEINVAKLADRKTNESAREAIMSLTKFQEIFSTMIDKKANGRPVYVFLDDLDRCQPDVALDILESIRVALTDVRCVFIVAVDERLIAEGLRLRYKDMFASHLSAKIFATKGQEYLEKIIQFRIRVLPRTSEQTRRFIAIQFPQWAVAGDIIQAVVGTNPRRLKQYAHRLTFQHLVGRVPFALGLRRAEEPPGSIASAASAEATGGTPNEAEQPARDAARVDEVAEELEATTDLLNAHRRRLRELEKQAALMGINTPASIAIEIEDIHGKLREIEAERARLRAEQLVWQRAPILRQRQALERQRAKMGLATPPEIENEIADLRAQLEDIEREQLQLGTDVRQERIQDIDELLAIYEQRLRQQEIKQAQSGIHTPPDLLIEIDDIKAAIGALRQEREQYLAPSTDAGDQPVEEPPPSQPTPPAPDEQPLTMTSIVPVPGPAEQRFAHRPLAGEENQSTAPAIGNQPPAEEETGGRTESTTAQ